MMNKYKFIKILFLATFLFSSSFSLSTASMSGIDVNLNVGGSCNNNGVCEAGSEDMFNCPADCTPIVVPPNPSGGGTVGGLVMDNVFNNLTVEVSYYSAIIRWQSSIPTMSNLKWGTSPDYKDGVIKNINFLLNHKVELTNLKDGTLYYFNIQAESLLGKTSSLDNQIFRTLSLPDTTPPENPKNIVIYSAFSGITLSWENPPDLDFDYIRVMRNADRSYGSPAIGKLVYEGKGKYFTDSDVIAKNKYFYSLFSRDTTGNYSSGSFVSIIHNPKGKDTWGTILPPKEEEIKPLTDIYTVTQGSSTYDFKIGSIFFLSGDEPIGIKTNYLSKTKNDDLWVEIRNSDREIISQYFFSRARDKEGFLNVTIPSFEKEGYYRISIYRYNKYVAQIINQGAFQINKMGVEKSINYFWYIICFIIFLILLIIFLWWISRRRKRKSNIESDIESDVQHLP